MHLGQVWKSRLEGHHRHYKAALGHQLGDVYYFDLLLRRVRANVTKKA